jgi:hypothetical protein
MLKDQVVRILNERAVGKIDFHLQSLQICGRGLREVGGRIRRGDIEVYHYAKLKAPARYFPKRDAIVVRTVGDDIASKGMIVHEAIHALLDLKKAVDTTALSDEVAAYIAQVIYLLHSGETEKDFSDSDRVFKETLKLVQKFNLTKGKVWLKWPHYQHLRTVVNQDPLYHKLTDRQLMVADGIRWR